VDELDALWDVQSAARWATDVRRRLLGPAARVSPETIWKWVERGHLEVAERFGKQLRLAPLAVARAERRTRDRARRVISTAA